MIIIADSGSTKTNWIISGRDGSTANINTIGLNPNFATSEDITNVLNSEIKGLVKDEKDIRIYFYGSGCSGDYAVRKVEGSIRQVFQNASIEVASDLLGAARALLGKEKGIACILGTGSNSCLYDGNNIVKNIPPLGFILGDEGSGAYLGKQLLSDYLKGIMPAEVSKLFALKFDAEKDQVIEKVYRGEFPNKYIASFVVFLRENLSNNYCEKLVSDSFANFIERNLMFYHGFTQLKVSFTGSIAWYFKDVLKNVMEIYGLNISEIIKQPSERIMNYHFKY